MIFCWTAFKLTLSVKAYDKWYKFRHIKPCLKHGYHAQSFWTGYCRKCGKVPDYPPIEEMCTFCSKEKAVKQISSPNSGDEIWSVCWECDQYIFWSECHAMLMNFAPEKATESFADYLFKHHQVYPKGEYSSITLTKKEKKYNE